MKTEEENAMQDYYRPVFHFTPRQGWMNDPNGLIQFRGTCHAFYQHNPYSPKRGPMRWGRAVSRDLVHWEHLPIALYPDQSYESGCFSGSAADNNGELTLIYTAHHDERSPRETQCLAFSRDGIYFTKYEKNPVIGAAPEGFSEEFRDPKVFRRGEYWYIVVGCARENRGGVLLYRSKDLRQWDLAGRLCESDGEQGIMWECPNFFELGGGWVLLVSPIDMAKARCVFITGEMDFEKPAFVQKQWRKADYGLDFYAPQVFTDEKGRRILFGWMDMWKGEFPTRKDGWAGAFSFPRELFLENGEVCQRPVEELALLRKKELFSGPLTLAPGKRNNLSGIEGDCLEIACTIPGNGAPVTMHLRASEDEKEKTVLQWDPSSRSFILDTRHSGIGRQERIDIPLAEDGEKDIDLRILMDRSSLELFLLGGKYTVTNWIFPRPSSVFYDIFAEGKETAIPDMRIFELG
ncbi:MAG: glycoside hydrolase family 32 protein [Treponema sp.]|nr:glycoside hydrolase family 32 protein [Treponema sp.]